MGQVQSKHILLIFFCICFFSCSKKDNLNGTVINANNGAPVADVFVSVERFSERGEDGSVSQLGQTKTDAQGHLSFDVSFKRMRQDYKIICSDFFPVTEDSIQKAYLALEGSRINLNHDTKQAVVFKVVPTVRLKTFVYAVKDYTEGDTLMVKTMDERMNRVFFVFPGSSTSGNSLRTHVPANNSGKIAIHVYKRRAGLVQEYTDSIVAQPFSKVDYQLFW